MSIEEGSHTLADGHKLYTKTFKTEGPAKARLVFIHGFSDVINAYGSFFPTLASKGIEVYTFDQRGWGRSVTKPSERGHTGPTSQVLEDITSFIKTVIPSPIPLFLMGHSMGGGEVLCYAAQGPREIRQHIRGYLLESPFVDFDAKSKPSPFTVFFGRLAGKLLPHRQLLNKLDQNLLSRDPEVCKQFDQDELCHDTGTLEGLSGLLDRTGQLASGKVIIPDDAGEGGVTRIWIAHGDKDGITDYQASKRLSDALQVKDKEFKTYAGYYHRLHDEPSPEKEVFIDDVANWILARSTEPVQGDSARPKL
ncbi:alpha/beta-hydrolase [Cucurbitaria berberidis CBS 394.84]|uniref:Alpha/beta-hydrolase n=1 Tax=Cucurbitaria berberidis CBS 394.84 TaxID=1168544 RepID=A0A9P4G9F2_9PLEO|nr:alpha/beta-hydrolase [Cucurbitaria berberidis CBS 394.84]KAF1841317.1 alpha/beta-hydrolase [Cucurbitaria berberidis CBS 394.84]